MVLGLGIDLIAVSRLQAAWQRRGDSLLHRLFTPHEQATAGLGPHRFRRLAARLAAKEALVKALGTGLRDGRWLDAEVKNDALGKPYLELSGGLARRAAAMGVVDLHLSLTHEQDHAAACVVLVGAPAAPAPAAGAVTRGD